MKLSPTVQRLAALLALAGVLFTQLAIAAYVCPSLKGGIETDEVAQSRDGQAMPAGCDELDPASPNLCLQHCQIGKQSLDHPEVPKVTPVLTVLYFVPQPALPAPRARPSDAVPELLARETGPPLAIRNCCFRI